MILSLLAIRSLKTFSKTLNGLPISRGSCKVTIGDSFWDLTDTAFNRPVMVIPGRGNITYYVKLCTELSADDVPSYAILDFGASAMMCDSDKETCHEIAYNTDFDYKPELPHNLTDGIIYFADGIPYKVSEMEYTLFEVVHNFHCNPSVKDPNVKPSTLIDSFGNNVRLILEYESAYGCPKQPVPTPSPTPIFEPDCKYMSRIEASNTSGINIDLATLNNGPVGVRSYFVSKGEPFLFFYTPCGRSGCPYGAKCNEPMSSAWICHITGSSIDICTSYGLENDKVEIELNGDEYRGIVHTLHHQTEDRSVQVVYTCDQFYPKGYLEMPLFPKQFIEGNYLKIEIDSQDVCVTKIPWPKPPSGDFCRHKFVDQNWVVDINLLEYNKDKSGYVQEVTVTNTLPRLSRRLIYQPCGSISCPDKYQCEGDEDATVWLCDKESGTIGQKLKCVGYGLFKYNHTAELPESYIMGGIDLTYQADLKRYAKVSMKCDKTLPTGVIALENEVELNEQTLLIKARSLGACAQGTGPTPPPPERLKPNVPPHGPTPTPTPNASPNPFMFHHNQTHYVYLALNQIDQTPYIHDQVLISRGKTGDIHTEFSPWNTLPCPANRICNAEFKEANMWSCWYNENNQQYCHPSGYKNFGLEMRPLTPDDLSTGIMLAYEGGYGTGVNIRLSCHPGLNPYTISNFESYVTFHSGMVGQEFEYSSETEVVCPVKFEDPYIPTATPTPSFDPNRRVNYKYESPIVNNKQVVLDLKKLPTIIEKVYMGYGKHFEINDIYLSPFIQTSCPQNYDCKGHGLANAWKCFGNGHNPECFPVGDARYNLHFELINDNLDHGVSVNYEGGYAGYEIHFNFQCNRSVPIGQITFDETGTKTPQNVMIVYAHTQIVCPATANTHEDATTGAIFLTITISSVIIYLIIGILITFFTTGQVSLPNSSFWIEFYECLKTGSAYVISCGKTTSLAMSYDTI